MGSHGRKPVGFLRDSCCPPWEREQVQCDPDVPKSPTLQVTVPLMSKLVILASILYPTWESRACPLSPRITRLCVLGVVEVWEGGSFSPETVHTVSCSLPSLAVPPSGHSVSPASQGMQPFSHHPPRPLTNSSRQLLTACW